MKLSSEIIIFLIVLQFLAVGFLWTLNSLSRVSEQTFALFLAVDLLSFSMVSYIYRQEKSRAHLSRVWVAVGSLMIIALLFSSLFFA